MSTRRRSSLPLAAFVATAGAALAMAFAGGHTAEGHSGAQVKAAERGMNAERLALHDGRTRATGHAARCVA